MAANSAEHDRWDGRPGQARALRTAVLVAPLVASLAVVAGLARLAGPVPRGAAGVVRLVLLFSVAMIAAAVAERLARRLLPLSILLELSMLFPDRAPSRLAVARRARKAVTSPQDLLASHDEDAASAALRILALMSALAAHDRRTRGHAERVRAFTDLLAARMDLPRVDRDKLRWAALLHDIGKLGVEPSLLNKPSRLNNAEWAAIKRHPVAGQQLAGPLLPWLGEWGKAIVEHHERFDGTGYPMGLSAMGISRAGRMVGVVDAYETMTAARAYKKAFATREARAELTKHAGTQFDPAVVRAFLAISLPRMLWASGPLSFLVQMPFLRVIEQAGVRVASVSSSVAATTTAVAGAAVIALPVVAAAGAHRSPPAPSKATSIAMNLSASRPRKALATKDSRHPGRAPATAAAAAKPRAKPPGGNLPTAGPASVPPKPANAVRRRGAAAAKPATVAPPTHSSQIGSGAASSPVAAPSPHPSSPSSLGADPAPTTTAATGKNHQPQAAPTKPEPSKAKTPADVTPAPATPTATAQVGVPAQSPSTADNLPTGAPASPPSPSPSPQPSPSIASLSAQVPVPVAPPQGSSGSGKGNGDTGNGKD